MIDFQPRRPWTFFSFSLAVARAPRRSFAALADERAIAPPLVYLAVLWLLIAALRGLTVLAGGPAVQWLALAWGPLWHGGLALCLWLSLRLIQHDAPLGRCLRIVFYGMGPWLLSAMAPLLPGLAAEALVLLLAVLILGYIYAGLIAACDLSASLAVACLIICLVLMAIAAAVAGQAGARFW